MPSEPRGSKREDPVSLYADPSLYDILHSPGTAKEAGLLRKIATENGIASGAGARWMEPACGSGRLLRALASKGLSLGGFDFNPAMLDYAERTLDSRGLLDRVELAEADMESFSGHFAANSFDLAFNTLNTLRHLNSDAAMLRHFTEMQCCLRPDSIYIVGMSFTLYGEEVPDEDSWAGKRGRCTVRQVVQYLPPSGPGTRDRFERVLSHLMVERPRGREHFDSSYDLRAYSQAQWGKLLARSPFRHIASVDDLGQPVGVRSLNYQLEILRPR